jgi:CRISPR-associated exonuclease Cas4
MLVVAFARGAVLWSESKRRRVVVFSTALREETRRAVVDIRTMLRDGALPPPVDDARCPPCSLVDACVPAALVAASRAVAAPPPDDE